jgi:hypothetical protein
MIKMHELTRTLERFVRSNSPVLLTSLGASGVITTAYLSGRASYKAALVIRMENIVSEEPLTKKDKARIVWKQYIPTAISAGLTIGCIIGGTKIGMKRTAAAYSLLTVSEKAFSEYKEKVIEQIGEKKEQGIRDAIAQDRVDKDQPKDVVVVGSGNVLCNEQHTGRYFNCDMETLRRAQNSINAKLIREMEATLSDFYYMVRLPTTSYSSVTGWNVDKMLELYFSSTLTEDGRPCLSFDYNYIIPF